MEVRLLDFGDIERVSGKFMLSADEGRPRPMRGAFNKIESEMRIAERALFSSQGRRGGGSWAHLKAQTIRKKGTSRILFTRGAKQGYSELGNDALFRSLTVRSAPDHIYHVVGYTMEFGTDNPHAAYAQHGTRRGAPRRPVLRFTQRDLDGWKAIISEQLMKSWLK